MSCAPICLRQREARVVDVRRDDARRARRFADADGEDADRSASGDEHRRAGNLGGEHGVERVAHRIVNAADVERDVVVEMPDVRRRHRDVLGETAVAIDADDLRVRADVRVAGAAEQASAVDDVAFGGHAIAFAHVGDEAADLHDFAGELVADDDRRFHAPLRPRVPIVDVNVGAADAGATHAISTSSSRIVGSGTFFRTKPGAAVSFTSAFTRACSMRM